MIYPYYCADCEVRFDRVCSLKEYELEPIYFCANCGRAATRVLCAPRTLLHTSPFEPFISPVDRTLISSRRELAEHNKRNNVVNTHDGYDEKAIMAMTKQDFQKPLDQERKVDLGDDLRKSVQKLEEGYVPRPAPEGEEL